MMKKRQLILSQSFALGRQAALICKGSRGQRRAHRPQDMDWESGYSAAEDYLVRRTVRLSPGLLKTLKGAGVPLTLAAELGLVLAAIGGVRAVSVEGDQVAIVLIDGRKIEWSIQTHE